MSALLNIPRFAPLLALLLLSLDCDQTPSDPYEKALYQSIACMKELNDVLDGVKTDADAKDAAPKISAIAERLRQVAKDAKALPAQSPQRVKEVQNKYDAQAKIQADRFEKNVKRFDGNMSVAQALAPSLTQFTGAVLELAQT